MKSSWAVQNGTSLKQQPCRAVKLRFTRRPEERCGPFRRHSSASQCSILHPNSSFTKVCFAMLTQHFGSDEGVVGDYEEVRDRIPRRRRRPPISPDPHNPPSRVPVGRLLNGDERERQGSYSERDFVDLDFAHAEEEEFQNLKKNYMRHVKIGFLNHRVQFLIHISSRVFV
ncbi:hypothetical protein NL676_001768 [Syzygium grande]|nr:hypothetical protein NL676_001768 [Syzygium grande]